MFLTKLQFPINTIVITGIRAFLIPVFVAFFILKCYIVIKKTTEKRYDNKTL